MKTRNVLRLSLATACLLVGCSAPQAGAPDPREALGVTGWYATPTPTYTPTPVYTPTPTPTPTYTPTPTPTYTPTPTPTPTYTPTPYPTYTPTPTPTPTYTPPPNCGPFKGFTQGGWGAEPHGNNPGAFLTANFQSLTGGTLVVGIGNTLTFTSAQAVIAFLPSGGTPGTLSASLTNPVGKTSAGVLAGQVTALELNVLANPGLAAVEILTGPFAGMTVGEFQLLAERVLGGDTSVLPAGATIASVNEQATAINEFFDGGRSPDGKTFGCP